MLAQKKDEDADAAVFLNLDKSTVLQEARAFHESPINPRKCRLILSKIAYLLYQSEPFGTKEATETFFAITKLFQNPDVSLRQMVYLVIKELAQISEDVIILTQSITKDMNAKQDVVYRANAIRALCKITDTSMLQSIERFLKQAIVDRHPSVSSAAMVSALHLFSSNKEIVKRWANEIQEALAGKVGPTAQYHALCLLYQIRQHDRMAVIKMVQNYGKGVLRSSYAQCMLVRYTAKVMDEEELGSGSRTLYEQLEALLRHKSDMVVYEAARAICGLKEVTTKELFPAVTALQLMLVSPKPVLRFAAIRTLNKLALTHPQAVAPCNVDMENLVTDANRSVATFAITTLLKTGNEASVDRLMKQISGFMSEISDEFKVIVVDAIRALCLKFPAKQAHMLNFLSGVLRDEGGFEYKKAIVEAIFDIVNAIPDAKEYAFSHLCEFIEDCEFTKLAVRILHLLGTEGPKTSQPSKYIRYIYNRVILENATVRAAAVSALAKFAVQVPDLKERIMVLLTRCLDDMDDEVRDRAALYLKVLENEQLSKEFLDNDSTFSWVALEQNLVTYLADPTAQEEPFDLAVIPVVTKTQEKDEKMRAKAAADAAGVLPTLKSPSTPSTPAAAASRPSAAFVDPQQRYAQELEQIPQIVALGPVFKSCKPVELTESETEYVVTCVKHVFAQHVVFQFHCKNTLNDSLLENVNAVMRLEPTDDEGALSLKPIWAIPIERLTFDNPAASFVAFERPPGSSPSASFACSLKFVVKDCDPTTGEPDEEGFADEYQIEDIELTTADYVVPSYVADFKAGWDAMGEDFEMVETYALTAVPSIRAAVTQIVDMLGLQPVEDSAQVKDKAATHVLVLSGSFVGGVPVLARCRMAFDPSSGVTLELSVRSKSEDVSDKIVNGIV